MNRVAVVTVSAVATAAVLAAVVWAADWPNAVSIALAAALTVAFGFALSWARSEREPDLPWTPAPTPTPAPAPPSPPPAVTLQHVPLPTADRDYRFLLHATVSWRVRAGAGSQQPPNPDAVATRMVIAKATEITAAEPPDRWDLVQHKLNRALSVPMTDATGSIEVWAHRVALSLPPEDYERQRQMSGLRKDEQVWEHQRNYERNVRAYLHNEALATTGSAVVWWLSHEPRQINQTAELIGTLARLTAAANDREVDPVFRALLDGAEAASAAGSASNGAARPALDGASPPDGSLFPQQPHVESPHDVAAANVRHLADSLLGIGAKPERARLGDQIARVVADYDHDLARRIREDFSAPDLDAEPPEPAESAGPGVPDRGADPSRINGGGSAFGSPVAWPFDGEGEGAATPRAPEPGAGGRPGGWMAPPPSGRHGLSDDEPGAAGDDR